MVKRRMYLLFLGVLSVCIGYAQEQPGFTSISLNNLDVFANPGGNWSVASDAVADINKEGDLKPVAGTGVLVNTVSRKFWRCRTGAGFYDGQKRQFRYIPAGPV